MTDAEIEYFRTTPMTFNEICRFIRRYNLERTDADLSLVERLRGKDKTWNA